MMMQAALRDDCETFEKLNGMECMECGSCTYICPAHIPLADLVRQAAGQVRELEKGGDLHG